MEPTDSHLINNIAETPSLVTVYFKSPIGVIEIKSDGSSICNITFQGEKMKEDNSGTDPIINKCIAQLEDYFNGDLKEFDLPLKPTGTSFQQTVWKALKKITFGKTVSYGELARELGDPKLIRAVGGANGKNPIAIVIPCHRVIGQDGCLTGYAGGLQRKQWLLDFERKSYQPSLFQ